MMVVLVSELTSNVGSDLSITFEYCPCMKRRFWFKGSMGLCTALGPATKVVSDYILSIFLPGVSPLFPLFYSSGNNNVLGSA